MALAKLVIELPGIVADTIAEYPVPATALLIAAVIGGSVLVHRRIAAS